jgi:EAL domain-containing protein (putative c-di-GMP-specific phosphodiesterase class I)
VALDDVGAEPMSLAAMPFVRPDVLELDRSLVIAVAASLMSRGLPA